MFLSVFLMATFLVGCSQHNIENQQTSSSSTSNIDIVAKTKKPLKNEIDDAPEDTTEDVPEEETHEQEENKKSVAKRGQNSSDPKTTDPKSNMTEPTSENSDTSTKPKMTLSKSSIKTTEYLLPSSNSEERTETPTHVVLHFVSNALNNPKDPYLIEDTYNIFKDYGVSAHYVIDRSGEIYLFVPEDRIAYHAGKGSLKDFPTYTDRLNHYSIGIELLAMGTREEMTPVITAEKFDLIDPSLIGYTEAQYHSLHTLLNDITKRHPNIKKDKKHIVGHDEYSGGRKTDPGSLFKWGEIGL